ncbi:MAG TPA: HdeD family acid-resistance protein [Candidatus Acidoferrales bacterium]|nr:HdeD family acid-resistance protein [Candidatus Acidoferrales bacterium]
MLGLLARNWWLLAIRGLAAVVFGLLCFFWPGLTLVVLITFFGAYALIDGISLIVALVRGDALARRSGWTVAIMGILGIAAGLIAFFWPGLTALTIAIVVGSWAIILGGVQIVAAVRLRREIEGEFWMGLAGVLAIIFGLYLLVLPGEGLVSLLWLVGAWSVVYGIFTLVLAWRLRGLASPAMGAIRA